MHSSPLFLTHWNDPSPVCISADQTQHLKDYHLLGIRFLYDSFHLEHKGAILNHDEGMNPVLQVSLFLNALRYNISCDNPVLIICLEEAVPSWHYNLVNHGGYDVTLLSTSNADSILESKKDCLILSTINNAAALKSIKEKEFFCVVVDAFDKLVTKSIVKQIKGQFNIGLTNRNFLKYPDYKLFWTMLNWSNPGVVGKIADFYREYEDHIRNLRYPYDNWWHHLTWKYCDKFIPPTEAEIVEHRSKINAWSKQYKLQYTKSVSRKRKHPKQECTVEINRNQSPTNKSEVALDLNTDAENSNATFNKSTSSNDTVIYDFNSSDVDIKQEDTPHKVNSATHSNDTVIYDFKSTPINDDDYILSSIISGEHSCTGLLKSESYEFDVKPIDAENIVTSIIENSPDVEATTRKKDLLSLLYGDDE